MSSSQAKVSAHGFQRLYPVKSCWSISLQDLLTNITSPWTYLWQKQQVYGTETLYTNYPYFNWGQECRGKIEENRMVWWKFSWSKWGGGHISYILGKVLGSQYFQWRGERIKHTDRKLRGVGSLHGENSGLQPGPLEIKTWLAVIGIDWRLVCCKDGFICSMLSGWFFFPCYFDLLPRH